MTQYLSILDIDQLAALTIDELAGLEIAEPVGTIQGFGWDEFVVVCFECAHEVIIFA